jgi:chorismate mutase/prephenate dehydratase
MNVESEDRLKFLRQKIDSLDEQILHLLNQRAEMALEVGRVKSETQTEAYNPQREEEILKRLESQNLGPFPQKAVSSVFREIISASRSLEAELTVVYLGPPATHTHLAAIERFGSSIQAFPTESIEEIFDTVERGKASFGVVPIENSTEGVVNRTLDMFIESEVKICGEVLVRISHDLLSRSGRPEKIRKIYSHPQALGQCRQWLRKRFPQIALSETTSTARAAQLAVEDEEAAAVASSLASPLYGLKVIESRIEDYLHNYTRFLVLGRQMMERTGKDKTSLLFSISHSPGSLHEILKPFSAKAINLTKIESRPIKNKPWEYVFFLDLEGHVTDLQVQEALTEMKREVLFFKLLGSYPRSS